MFTFEKNKSDSGKQVATAKWCDYLFTVYPFSDVALDIENNNFKGIFILAGKTQLYGDWVPYFIDFCPSNFGSEAMKDAKKLGATHVHILTFRSDKSESITEELIKEYQLLYFNIIGKHQPELNKQEKFKLTGKLEMTTEDFIPSELNELKAKLELLYTYQAHYLGLIKEYKEEIKFSNALQEDLRRERSQFFTQTLKDVVQTMNAAEVDKNVSNKWIEELVSTYTKSLDLSSDLAKTHVIDILGMLTNEAKNAAVSGQLDKIKKADSKNSNE